MFSSGNCFIRMWSKNNSHCSFTEHYMLKWVIQRASMLSNTKTVFIFCSLYQYTQYASKTSHSSSLDCSQFTHSSSSQFLLPIFPVKFLWLVKEWKALAGNKDTLCRYLLLMCPSFAWDNKQPALSDGSIKPTGRHQAACSAGNTKGLLGQGALAAQ